MASHAAPDRAPQIGHLRYADQSVSTDVLSTRSAMLGSMLTGPPTLPEADRTSSA